jgi:hypothetical protein
MQVDTVMGLLSPLVQIQRAERPDGYNVLSICSGIGGVEVALAKLDVRVKRLVFVEKDDLCSEVRFRFAKLTRLLQI